MVDLVNLKIRYTQVCKALYGKILGAPVPEARFMVAATETTIQRWKKRFPTEPYHHIGQFNSTLEEIDTRISYDLVEAVLRQSSFYFQVSANSQSLESLGKSDAHIVYANVGYGFVGFTAPRAQ